MSQILLIDDSPDFLDVFNWCLKRKGYTCETAYYRERVFDKLSGPLPALIIIDINLGSEDGRFICRDIKKNNRTRNIPVILCSARHDLLKDYSLYMADDFLEKPFDINSVVIKIEKLISN